MARALNYYVLFLLTTMGKSEPSVVTKVLGASLRRGFDFKDLKTCQILKSDPDANQQCVYGYMRLKGHCGRINFVGNSSKCEFQLDLAKPEGEFKDPLVLRLN